MPVLAMSGTDMWMMGLKMVAQILIGIGAVLNGLAIAGLFRDCYRDYGDTMGGDPRRHGLYALRLPRSE